MCRSWNEHGKRCQSASGTCERIPALDPVPVRHPGPSLLGVAGSDCGCGTSGRDGHDGGGSSSSDADSMTAAQHGLTMAIGGRLVQRQNDLVALRTGVRREVMMDLEVSSQVVPAIRSLEASSDGTRSRVVAPDQVREERRSVRPSLAAVKAAPGVLVKMLLLHVRPQVTQTTKDRRTVCTGEGRQRELRTMERSRQETGFMGQEIGSSVKGRATLMARLLERRLSPVNVLQFTQLHLGRRHRRWVTRLSPSPAAGVVAVGLACRRLSQTGSQDEGGVQDEQEARLKARAEGEREKGSGTMKEAGDSATDDDRSIREKGSRARGAHCALLQHASAFASEAGDRARHLPPLFAASCLRFDARCIASLSFFIASIPSCCPAAGEAQPASTHKRAQAAPSAERDTLMHE